MADLSWIDPLFKNARSAFGLDPKQAAEGQLMQKHGDLYTAQTETEKYRLGQLLPAQKGVFDADAGHKRALGGKVTEETRGIKHTNDSAQRLSELLSDPTNYITTPDGRRVPDVNKIHGIIAASAGAGGSAGVKNVPGIIGGFNLQAAPLSPGANLAAGGTNATAGANMLKPIQLNPDQTLIQKDPLTGQPITGAPMAAPQITLPSMAAPLTSLPPNAEVLKAGSFDPKALSEILTGANKASMDKVGISMPGKVASNLPYTAPASSTKLQIADANNDTEITKVEKQIEAKIAIAQQNGASREEVARIRNEGAEAVARIRGKGKGASSSGAAGVGQDGGVAPIDLNRLADREKAASEYLVNSFGKSGHNIDPNQAALLAAAATQSFPNDPAGVAVQKFMTQNGITSDTGGWSRVDFSQNGKPMDFNALRTKLFGAQPGPAAAATGAPGTPLTADGKPADGSVAGVVAGGSTPAGAPAGGVNIEGVPFEPDKVIAKERSHGDKYTGIDKRTGKLTTAYWDAEALNGKGAWSDAPIGGRQEDFDKVGELEKTAQRRSTKGWNLPASAEEAKGAEDELLKLAVEKGALSPEEYDAVTKFGQVSGSKRSTALRVVEKLKAMESEEAKRDPRVKSYAKGDFLDDKGIPDDALELAERLGIDRAAYGLPKKVDYSGAGTNIAGNLYDDFKGSALGAVFTPSAYSDERSAIESGLKAFFTDLQAGKVKTSPQPRNDVPPAAGPVGSSSTEAAPELPAETKVEPPSIPKGVPTQTKKEPAEMAPEAPAASVADVVAPKKEISKEELERNLKGKGFGGQVTPKGKPGDGNPKLARDWKNEPNKPPVADPEMVKRIKEQKAKDDADKKAADTKKAEKPKSVADVVTPKKDQKRGMTPDEIKIMLAEDFRKEVERRNKNKP
jgi:hypothetical protein